MPCNCNFNFPFDACLKLCEEEIRYGLYPTKKKGELITENRRLQKRKDATEGRLKDLEASGVQKRTRDVCDWLDEVEIVNVEVNDLLESLLSKGSCWCNFRFFLAKIKLGRKADELLAQVGRLATERGGWGDDEKLIQKIVPVVLATESRPQPVQGREELESGEEDPWKIFSANMDGGLADLSHPSIQLVAKAMVMECRGLRNEVELALSTLARAVKDYTTVGQWEDAIKRLKMTDQSASQEISPCMPTLQSILQFCYKSLESDHLRSCLLYCSLFHRKQVVVENDLIEGWIGEGLLAGENNVVSAYGEGQRALTRLKDSLLLESNDWCDFYLRVNDHVRSMVHNVNSTVICKNCVLGNLGWWSATTRISLMEYTASSLPNSAEAFLETSWLKNTPSCRYLVTLLARGNQVLQRLHNDFFRLTPALRVLDLSNTKITEIPTSIQFLGELRHLNLKQTKIRSLPVELGSLANLQHLDLGETRELKNIPRESITMLSKLQVLRLDKCGHMWHMFTGDNNQQSLQQHNQSMALLRMEDLRDLKRIQHLSLTVNSIAVLQEVQQYHSMTTTALTFSGVQFMDRYMRSAFSSLPRLQWLELYGCSRMEELMISRNQLLHLQELKVFNTSISRIVPEENKAGIGGLLPNLRHVGMSGCHSLKDLTWVGHLTKLELVCLQRCEGITRLINRFGDGNRNDGMLTTEQGEDSSNDDNGSSFPNLQFLALHDLPRLQSFSWRHPLRLPSLRTLRIRNCPRLMRLPFGENSCKKIKEIRGTRDWWTQLQWDSQVIQTRFNLWFQAY